MADEKHGQYDMQARLTQEETDSIELLQQATGWTEDTLVGQAIRDYLEKHTPILKQFKQFRQEQKDKVV